LVKLFDPILARSGARLLSGDSVSLRAACEAVADCDHNHLVKIAVDRAAREVRTPLHVKDICRDARESYDLSKVSGGSHGDVASPEEIAELIAKERAARLGRKR
jgi:hypothetical protein